MRHTSSTDLDMLADRLAALAESHETLVTDYAALHHRLREVETTRLTELAQIAHELKKPLAILRIQAERLRPTAEPTILNAIDREVGRIGAMCDGLMTLTRLELGVTSAADTIDLSRMCEECTTDYARLYPAHHWHHTIEPDIHIVTHPEHIAVILENLFQNSANYTPDGGVISLALTCDSQCITLSICDTGQGFVAGDADELCQPFTRGAADYTTGSGLGLAIISRAVEVIGGALTIESAIDRGSTFTITIPRTR